MMNVAKVLGAGPRGSMACTILRNVQWNCQNVTRLYRMELRMKHRLLLEAGQVCATA
jgi:hypothetical protein